MGTVGLTGVSTAGFVNRLNRSEYLEEWCGRWLTKWSRSAAVEREKAATALGVIFSAESIDALVGVLCDSNKNVARIAHDSLVKFGSAAVPSLARKHSAAPDSKVRNVLSNILGEIGDPEAKDALLLALPRKEERECAMRALANLAFNDGAQKQAVVEAIGNYLLEEGGERVAETLGEIKAVFAVPYLIRAASQADSKEAKEQVVSALAKIDYTGDGTAKREAFNCALSGLKEGILTAPCAVAALAGADESWSREAVDALVAEFKTVGSPMRKAIVGAFSSPGLCRSQEKKTEVAQLLLPLINGSDLSDGAVKALGELGKVDDPSLAEQISQVLFDALGKRLNKDTHKAVAAALARLEGEAYVGAVLGKMQKADLTTYEGEDIVGACMTFFSSVEYSSDQSRETATNGIASLLENVREAVILPERSAYYAPKVMRTVIMALEKINHFTRPAVKSVASCLDIDMEGLAGGASLHKKEFVAIMRSAAKVFRDVAYSDRKALASARKVLRKGISKTSPAQMEIALSLRRIGTGKDQAFVAAELAYKGATLPRIC